ncbi:MAG: ATP-dependent DNA helicase [Candidatus Magasanikbacteria bacterium]|nr:ATP-dependent DNA helicase [Candidatus Magasanikbacteria bacterium]
MIDFRADLNDEQYTVVTKGDGACLVLAGAGSGKTRAITYRVAYLLEQGIPEDRILLVTFTNKASREMLGRVETILGRTLPRLWGGTFHRIALRILRAYAQEVGHTPNFTILDSDDSQSMIALVARDEGIDVKNKQMPSLAIIQDTLSYSRNAEGTISDTLDLKYPRFLDRLEMIEHISRQYEQKKREANVMDFDDLLVKLNNLLLTNASVRQKFSEQFQYVLVDEYQDTNRLQASIVNALSSHHKNILVVGDDAQSIYSFRAADIQNILAFEKQFFGAKVFRLETNYRSTPDILNLANCVIAQNVKQYPKNLKAVCGPLAKPLLVPAPTQYEEAHIIADKIISLLNRGVPAKEIAVLFRATFHSQMLELELMKRGVAYDYRGGLKFFDRAHVKDVLSFLRIFNNVHDVIAWSRILKLQAGVGERTAQEITAALKQMEKFEDVVLMDVAAQIGPRAATGWAQVQRIAEAMISASKERPAELIRACVNSFYKEFVEGEFTNWRDRLDDIEQLTRFAERSRDLSHFLADASLSESYASDRDQKENQREQVVLSTVHQAKGLEWDAVFVINLTDGGFPNERALKEPNGIEEERRLFYVAVTRARRHLFLTYPILGGRDASQISAASPFIDGVDRGLLDIERDGQTVGTLGNEDARYVDDDGEAKSASKIGKRLLWSA